MEKLRNELLGAPERHSKIQYLCPVQELKLKATHTSERLVNMDAIERRDTVIKLQRCHPGMDLNWLLYTAKLSENGIITAGAFNNKCYALDAEIYFIIGDDGYHAIIDIDFITEPSRGSLFSYQWNNRIHSTFTCINKAIKTYGLSEILSHNSGSNKKSPIPQAKHKLVNTKERHPAASLFEAMEA